MLKHQERLNRVLGGRVADVPALMDRTCGPAGVFGPRGVFGSQGMFGPRGMFGRHGMFGHRRNFGHRGMFGNSRLLWRRRPRRLLPILLGLLLVGIATAVMSSKGERSGNWLSV